MIDDGHTAPGGFLMAFAGDVFAGKDSVEQQNHIGLKRFAVGEFLISSRMFPFVVP